MSYQIFGGLMLVAALSLVTSRAGATEVKDGKLKLADCPAAVQKTLQREAHGATIDDVDKEIANGKTIYEVDIKIEGKNYEMTVAEDGTLLEKVLDDDYEEDAKEEKIKLSDCPTAVQRTLKREAIGASIDTVDKEVDDGKTIYEVDVKIDGKNYEIKVAADGTLISKSLDEEEGEGK